jgi:hypothetical protein
MIGAMISPLSESSSIIEAESPPTAAKLQDHQGHKIKSSVYFHADEFTRLLYQDDARMLVDLLKLAVAGNYTSWRNI